MNGARDFACRNVRTALGLERAGLAVLLARKVDHRAVLGQPVARLGESAVVFLELFAAGADIKVAFLIEGEVAAGEGSVRALCLVDRVHVRLDPALVHQPPDHLGRAEPPSATRRDGLTANCSAVRSSLVLAAPTSAWRIVVG